MYPRVQTGVQSSHPAQAALRRGRSQDLADVESLRLLLKAAGDQEGSDG
ncbi:MAG: hypothetical protein GY719_08180 [bacterium]|nr:hypothetical protein [bacterium]